MRTDARHRGGRGRRDRSLHAEVLHRLVAGAPGSSTAEIQLLYDAVAPLVYRGTTESPVRRRWRREKLAHLAEEGVVASHDTPRGRVWVPLVLPRGMDARHPAAARSTDPVADDVEG